MWTTAHQKGVLDMSSGIPGKGISREGGTSMGRVSLREVNTLQASETLTQSGTSLHFLSEPPNRNIWTLAPGPVMSSFLCSLDC